MTKGLLKSCNKRSILYKKYIKSKTQVDRDKYIKYRNRLKTVIDKSKADFYHNKFQQIHSNIRQTWQLLNAVTKGHATANEIAYITVDGEKTSDNTIIANNLNKYFINIDKDLASKIPSTTSKYSDYLRGDFSSSLTLYPVDAHEKINIADKLSNKDSSGYDEIPVDIMKKSILNIAGSLLT